jgi:catechol 2,3-dioxygenase-like lactoylglutathione lyase family enzyme
VSPRAAPGKNARVNPFGHIDLRVADMAAAQPFYAALLPALGFVEEYHGAIWKVWAAAGPPPETPYFALTEDVGHVPNASRIAFWVPSPADVDRIGDIVRAAGGRVESGPRPCPEYSDSYYAVFFADPSGNRLEVYCRTS